jgi:hypothetical protein
LSSALIKAGLLVLNSGFGVDATAEARLAAMPAACVA